MKQIFIPVILSCMLLFSGCTKGNVSNARIILNESILFTQAEIEDAMDVAIGHFKAEFEGYTLLEMKYDETHSLRFSEEWAQTYGADEGIVLLSSFEVDDKGGDGSFNPNDTYRNWQWVLVRTNGGEWELKTWGYS